MGETINLRTARKQRLRAEARAATDAATNRTAPSGAEADRARAEAALERRRLDAHRRDRDGEPEA